MGRLKSKKFLLIITIVILLILGSFFLLRGKNQPEPPAILKVSVAQPTAKVDLNQDFNFPITDEKGAEVTRIKVNLQNAQLQDEIIVAGQKATSVDGKNFLVINFKLTNDFNKSITLNSRDFFRLSVNKNDQELLAPEIHNDPVEISAISTKFTRVGFTINDTDQNLTLKVGEITKDKSTIPLNFQK